jgi:Rps23 Pro-64 3,4-dihydroxylase Tpa1-like proline 4-hydroxylase
LDQDEDSQDNLDNEEGKSRKRKSVGPLKVMTEAVDILHQMKNRSAATPTNNALKENRNEDFVFASYLANELSKIKSIKNEVKIKLQTVIFEAQNRDEDVRQHRYGRNESVSL